MMKIKKPPTLDEIAGWKGERIGVDIDGVLTINEVQNFESLNFEQAERAFSRLRPNRKMISYINRLYLNGNEICLFTSRALYYRPMTEKYLKDNHVLYHHLIMGKPWFRVLIDDKATGDVIEDED